MSSPENMNEMNNEKVSRNFIQNIIDKDLAEGKYDKMFQRIL